MNHFHLMQGCFGIAVFLVSFLVSPSCRAGAGDIESGFPSIVLANPGTYVRIASSAVQADGKTLIAGAFHSINGQPLLGSNLARLNTNGTRDTSFLSYVNGEVYNMVIQPDGKILVAGIFTATISPGPPYSSALRQNLARFHTDGSLDTSFNVNISGFSIRGLTLQSDGKILIAGSFTSIAGSARTGFARLNSDGTLDSSFNPVMSFANGSGALVQTDGKIMVWGLFSTVNGTARLNLARLNQDGTLDTTFDAGTQNSIQAVVQLPDGNYLIGKNYNQSGGKMVIRVSATGALDTSYNALFNVDSTNTITSLALQADGKVIVGGRFSSINGTNVNQIARLHTDGSVDTSFIANLADTADVRSILLKEDGRLLVGTTNGAGFYRLLNDVAIESLSAPTVTSVRWTRNGTSPQVDAVSFELSTNGGSTWAPLGAGARNGFDWNLTGVSVSSGLLRATATIRGGYSQGTMMSISSIEAYPALTPDIQIEQPVGTTLTSGASSFDLGSLTVGSLSEPLVFQVTNLGPGTLKHVLVGVSGANAADFAVTQLTQTTLAASASGVVSVRFKPTALGARSATLHFTSNDPAEADFTVNLSGTAIPSSDARLASLIMTNGIFSPAFSSSTYSYSATVQSHISTLNLSFSTQEPNATLTLNGAPVAGTSPTLPVNLTTGENVFTIQATAQDGITSLTYTLTVQRAATVAPGDLDPSLTLPNLNASVRASALQADGKLIVAGLFNPEYYHQGIIRLNADGTVDESFTASVPGGISSVIVLDSGKILIAGYFSSIFNAPRGESGTPTSKAYIALLNADGTLDTSFNATVNQVIECMALQNNGKVLIGGLFTEVNGSTRRHIARLNANGTLDSTFDAGSITHSAYPGQSSVNSIGIQADGKIVFAGFFDAIDAVSRAHVARVSSTGTLDSSLSIPALGGAESVRILKDQRILVSTSISGTNPHQGLVLLNSNGDIDESYTAGMNGGALSVLLQADGSTICAGPFNLTYDAVQPGPTRNGLLRHSATGVLDPVFKPDVSGNSPIPRQVDTLMGQDDGKIIIGGFFQSLDNIPSAYFARLSAGPASQSLSAVGTTTVEWMRGGSLAEVDRVDFDLSTDDGATFTHLGAGTRIAGGWQLTGQSLPVTGGLLRGRARCIGGYRNGSSGFLSFSQVFSPSAPEIVIEDAASEELTDAASTIAFGNVGINVPNRMTFTIRNAGGEPLTGLSAAVTPNTHFSVTDQPDASVSALGSTTFIVQAKVTSAGAKTATLTIQSNDGDEDPFTITLTGTGVTTVLPTATTMPAINLGFGSGTSVDIATATLNGTVDANGHPRAISFEYGTTTAYGTRVSATPNTMEGTTSAAASAELTGLPPHTTFNYRVRADGPLGNALGSNRTFTTANHAPVAENDVAINLASAAVTIDVLENDSDADLDDLTITAKTAVTPSTAGTVAIVANRLVFTASAQFGNATNLSATFGYTVGDGFGMTDTGSVTVTPGSATLNLTTQSVPSAGITYPVEITTTSTWAVTESLAWASVKPSRGVGSATMQITLTPNTATTARSGTLRIGGVSHSITQEGVRPPSLSAVTGTLSSIVGDPNFSIVISTTNPPVTYTLTKGSLPDGITLDQAKGELKGVPEEPGVFNIIIKATNLKGSSSTPNFTLNVSALRPGIVGTFHGTIGRSSTVNLTPTPNLGARFQLTATAKGSVSGAIFEGVTQRNFTGQIVASLADPDHPTLIAKINNSTHVLDLIFDNTNDSLSGNLRNATSTASAPISGWGNAWSATVPIRLASAYKAKHNFYLKNSSAEEGPQGHGYGTFLVAEKTGIYTLTGRLPDGSKLLCSSFVGQHGEVLLYQPLHANRGSCFGQLTVTPNNAPLDNRVTGTLTWHKPESLPAAKDTVYADGFESLTLEAEGSTYIAPGKGLIISGFNPVTLGNTNAKLSFAGGGLNPNFDQPLRLFNASSTGLVNSITIPTFASGNNPNKVVMDSFAAATGLFAGDFIIPGTAPRTAPFFGQIVRVFGTTTTYQGYGYFLLPSVPTSGQTLTTSPKLSGSAQFVTP